MLLLALVAIAVLAPQIVDLLGLSGPNMRNPGAVNSFGVPSGLSSAHPFGVDHLGRDVLARVLYGLRTSLEAGSIGAIIAGAIGTVIGFLANSSPRWIGAVLMGAVDAFLAFPALLLGLGFAVACRDGGCVRGLMHTGLSTVIVVIVLSSFPYVARSVSSRGRTHLLPALAAYSIMLIAPCMVLEAALSFLGVGVGGRSVSLGAMIFGGGSNIVGAGGAWWYLVFPGVALLLCVVAFQLLGNGLLRVCGVPVGPPRTAARPSASRYIALRIVRAAVLVVVVSAATYAIFRAMPAKAATDRSFWDLLHLDLGRSYRPGHSVLSLIVNRLPATASVLGGALVVCLVLAVLVGILWARARGRILGRAALTTALPLSATPVFWVGLLGIYLFSTSVGLVPVFDGPGAYRGLTVSSSRWFGSLLLPWLVLAVGFVPFYARVLRSSLVSAMSETYIHTARAKGLAGRRVLRHVLRAAAPPMVPVFGLGLGALLSAVILIETVFNIPGIGRLAYEAIVKGDYPVVQGTVLLAAFLMVIASLIIDIANALLDPRVRRL